MARSPDPIKARSVATRVVRTLRAAGHNALFAGGCVRDELLGLHPTDYDIATSATPPDVRRLFQSVHEVGEAFGVMLVNLDNTTVEVATFRTDGDYTDKRRPDAVTFSDDKADAARRDFTINALFLDPTNSNPASPNASARNPPASPCETERSGVKPEVKPSGATHRNPIGVGGGSATPGGVHSASVGAAATSPLGGTVIDYVSGLPDLRAGLIRAVGNPDARLNEDHLRALRAVRFAARLGFTIEPTTASAIRAHAAQLKGVSRERIGEELRRMLTHPAPASRARAAQLLQDLTLDAPALGEPTAATPTTTVAALPAGATFAASLAAWLIDRHALFTPSDPRPDPKPLVARTRPALCLTNIERDELTDILACFNELMSGWATRRVAAQKRWAAHPGFLPALACLAPHHSEVAAKVRELRAALAQDGVGIAPPPLVDGEALIELGFKPGPVFKSLLERLYDEQLEGRLKTKAEGLELARVWGV